MKIKITQASKYHAQGQVVECPKSVGLRFIALGKAMEYNDNDNEDQQDDLEDSGSKTEVVQTDASLHGFIPDPQKSIDESFLTPSQTEPQPQKETKRSIIEALAMAEAADINFDPSPTPRRKRKARQKRST